MVKAKRFNYQADGDVSVATLTVKNEEGEDLSGALGPLSSGEGEVTWNGKDMNGQDAPKATTHRNLWPGQRW